MTAHACSKQLLQNTSQSRSQSCSKNLLWKKNAHVHIKIQRLISRERGEPSVCSTQVTLPRVRAVRCRVYTGVWWAACGCFHPPSWSHPRCRRYWWWTPLFLAHLPEWPWPVDVKQQSKSLQTLSISTLQTLSIPTLQTMSIPTLESKSGWFITRIHSASILRNLQTQHSEEFTTQILRNWLRNHSEV